MMPEPEAPPSELAAMVALLTQQVGALTAVVAAMQERERWYARRRLANPEQQLAIARQITVPKLLSQLHNGRREASR